MFAYSLVEDPGSAPEALMEEAYLWIVFLLSRIKGPVMKNLSLQSPYYTVFKQLYYVILIVLTLQLPLDYISVSEKRFFIFSEVENHAKKI